MENKEEAQRIIDSIPKKKKSRRDLIIYPLIFILIISNFYLLYLRSVDSQDETNLINDSVRFGAYILNNQIGELAKQCRIIPIRYEDKIYNLTSIDCLKQIGG